MTAVIRSSATGQSATGGAGAVTNKPAGLAVGDLLVGFHSTSADTAVSTLVPPSGFNPFTSQASNSTSNIPACKVSTKDAAADDVAATTFTFADGAAPESTVILVAIEAGTYDPTTPLTVSAYTAQAVGANLQQTAPSIAADAADRLLCAFAMDCSASSHTYPASGGTAPTGMSQVAWVKDTVNYSMQGLYTEVRSAAGATGTRTVTPGGATSLANKGWAALSVLVNPAPAGATLVRAGGTSGARPVGRAKSSTLGRAAGTAAGRAVTAAKARGVGRAGSVGQARALTRSTILGRAGGVAGARRLAVNVAPADLVVEAQPVTVSHVVDVAAAEVVAVAAGLFAGSTSPDSAELELVGPDLTFGFAGDGAVNLRGLPPVYAPRPWRLLAQRILTGEWLHWELPVTDPEIEWQLSGTTEITGSFKPEIGSLADVGLEPWGTWIHLEEDGVIRGSAIMQPTSVQPDGTLALRAVGPHGYASRVPFRGRLSLVQVDPADVVRTLWAHIQGFPRGNLGVQVLGSTPRRIGTEARDVEFVTGAGEQVTFVAGPYQLNYWQNTLVGKEIEDLSKETPFDFTEWSGWSSPARTAVTHRIHLDYPQRGSRRFDLRFVHDENITEAAAVEEPDGAYADSIYVQGKGEGLDQVSGSASLWVGQRLRLPAIVDDKTIDSTSRANAVAAEELAARLSALIEVPEIVVDARHRNAPLGSFGPGDEVRPVVRYPYIGQVGAWHRVTHVRYLPLRNRAIVGLTRRGEFRG